MNLVEKVLDRLEEVTSKQRREKRKGQWRTWPLDPKNPEGGTLSVQKAGHQQQDAGPGRTVNWITKMGKTRPVKRTRVTRPATELGVKGKQTHHTTAYHTRDKTPAEKAAMPATGDVPVLGNKRGKPLRVKRRTSVTGRLESPGGKQIKVPNFPSRHSFTKDPSIREEMNFYDKIYGLLLESWSQDAVKRHKAGKRGRENARRDKLLTPEDRARADAGIGNSNWARTVRRHKNAPMMSGKAKVVVGKGKPGLMNKFKFTRKLMGGKD